MSHKSLQGNCLTISLGHLTLEWKSHFPSPSLRSSEEKNIFFLQNTDEYKKTQIIRQAKCEHLSAICWKSKKKQWAYLEKASYRRQSEN